VFATFLVYVTHVIVSQSVALQSFTRDTALQTVQCEKKMGDFDGGAVQKRSQNDSWILQQLQMRTCRVTYDGGQLTMALVREVLEAAHNESSTTTS
jgi:hypothetical protein